MKFASVLNNVSMYTQSHVSKTNKQTTTTKPKTPFHWKFHCILSSFSRRNKFYQIQFHKIVQDFGHTKYLLASPLLYNQHIQTLIK